MGRALLLVQPAEGPLHWTVELRVHGALGPARAERERFDAAIVVDPWTALAVGVGGAGLAPLPASSESAVRGFQEILAC